METFLHSGKEQGDLDTAFSSLSFSCLDEKVESIKALSMKGQRSIELFQSYLLEIISNEDVYIARMSSLREGYGYSTNKNRGRERRIANLLEQVEEKGVVEAWRGLLNQLNSIINVHMVSLVLSIHICISIYLSIVRNMLLYLPNLCV